MHLDFPVVANMEGRPTLARPDRCLHGRTRTAPASRPRTRRHRAGSRPRPPRRSSRDCCELVADAYARSPAPGRFSAVRVDNSRLDHAECRIRTNCIAIRARMSSSGRQASSSRKNSNSPSTRLHPRYDRPECRGSQSAHGLSPSGKPTGCHPLPTTTTSRSTSAGSAHWRDRDSDRRAGCPSSRQ